MLSLLRVKQLLEKKWCTKPTCLYDTDTDIPADSALADRIALHGLHMQGFHTTPPQQQTQDAALQQPQMEQIQKPKLRLVEGEVTEEEWEYFNHEWDQFKGLARVGIKGRCTYQRCWGMCHRRSTRGCATLHSQT